MKYVFDGKPICIGVEVYDCNLNKIGWVNDFTNELITVAYLTNNIDQQYRMIQYNYDGIAAGEGERALFWSKDEYESWKYKTYDLTDPIDDNKQDPFTKHDDSKSRVDLIEPKFILGMGDILKFGAEKYGENNWKHATVDDVNRCEGALMRHLLAIMDGEINDPESGMPHTYHIGCNAMFLDYFNRKGIK